MLQEIGALPVNSPERRSAFQRMHETLRAHPAAGAGVLSSEEQTRLTRGEAVATSRTWAFPLHDASAIRRLREDIRLRIED